MPNKRNKNRKGIAIRFSDDRQNELNEYLNSQKNLKETVQLALLFCKKTFGLQDLPTAYQNYSLEHMETLVTDFTNINSNHMQKKTPSSTNVDLSAVPTKIDPAPIKKKEDFRQKEEKVTKPIKKSDENLNNDKLNPSEINKLFYSGESSDL